MKDIDREAFEPFPFPELGPDETFNANFCRNPMCPAFGPAENPDDYAGLYSVHIGDRIRTDRRYACRTCGVSSRLMSNRSLHTAYVWFKRQSIPFATCPQEGCGSAGVNVFEHWGPDLTGATAKTASPPWPVFFLWEAHILQGVVIERFSFFRTSISFPDGDSAGMIPLQLSRHAG